MIVFIHHIDSDRLKQAIIVQCMKTDAYNTLRLGLIMAAGPDSTGVSDGPSMGG